MARSSTRLSGFFLFVLLASFSLLACTSKAARPLNAVEIKKGLEILMGGREIVYYTGAIKHSGPSAGGSGHQMTTSETLGGIKHSGPSAGGNGHHMTTSQSLGGMKNSGPSAGGSGHHMTTSQTFGGIKNSGPSPGVGH